MKNIIIHRKTIALVLFTICLIFSAEGTSHGFFDIIFGAIFDVIEAIVDVVGIVVQITAGVVQIAVGVVGFTIQLVTTVLLAPGSISDIDFFPIFPHGAFIGISASNHIGLWDPETMTETARFQYDARLTSIAFSPNGDLVASGSVDNTLQLWDPRTHTLQATLRGHTGAVLSVVFSPDGTLLASGSVDNTVRLWDPQTRALQATLRGHTGDVLNVTFNPNGLLLASGSADGTLRLWDPQTQTLQATLEGHTEPVLSIAFSPDGSLLASGSADDTFRLWDPQTQTSQDAFDFEADVLSLAFNPAGTLLAIGSVDGTARLWDLAESQITATLGHESPVENVVFTPDGSTLVSSSADGKVRNWEITVDGESHATDGEAEDTSATCQVGDVLAPGDSCTYPGTDAVFSVLANGKSRWSIPGFPLFDKASIGGKINFTGTINGKKYHFVASAVQNNSWRITEIGDDPNDQPVDTRDPVPTQQPVNTGGTPTLTAATASPLTEATLNKSVVTLTLSDGTYERSRIQIGKAVSVSGIPGVTIGTFGPAWFGVDRVSDTQITVELGFNGNIDTDSTLTFTLGSDAIAGYGGSALTTQVAVSAVTESVVASTASPLTEATLNESIVTLTLSGAKYERSVFDIGDAVSVSGIPGVRIGTFGPAWFGVDRVSDTQITVELGFNGNIDTDSTLTFTLGSDAIAGYNGPSLTAEVPVTAIAAALLRNFPNPFNPETWIPYQLSKPADVTLMIYDIQGRVVRALDLGHQRAGQYQTRSRAAYWDGRNAFGEPVASGLYFYTLTAGDFTATRKMLIRK